MYKIINFSSIYLELKKKLADKKLQEAKDAVGTLTQDQLKLRAAEGCPHSARMLVEFENMKKRNEPPPISARILPEDGDDEFTIEELKKMAAMGNGLAAQKLRELDPSFFEPDVDELEKRAEAGCPVARAQLASMHEEESKKKIEKHNIETLKARADQGCPHAKAQLEKLEEEKANIEALKARAAQGCPHAKAELEKLAKPTEALKAAAAGGCPHARAQLGKVEKSAEDKPNIEALKARAEQGCPHAKAQLKELEEKGEEGCGCNKVIDAGYNNR